MGKLAEANTHLKYMRDAQFEYQIWHQLQTFSCFSSVLPSKCKLAILVRLPLLPSTCF